MERKKKWRALLITFICLLPVVFVIGIILPAVLPYKPPKSLVCLANLHCLNVCFRLYLRENDVWPENNLWCDQLKPYVEDDERDDFLCPADKIGPCSYAMNENIPADVNDLPGDLVVLFESAPGWNRVGGVDDVETDRHKPPGANIAFADGLVDFVEAEDIPTLRWTVDANEP